MSLRCWVAGICVLLCTCAAPAKQFDDPDPARIDHAIDELASTNWRERRDAVHQLVRIGPPAQQRLEKLIEAQVAPETRLRAQAALAQILPQRRIDPALITREFVDANVAETFAKVAEIEGAELRCEPPELIRNIKHHITVRYQHELYWNVMLDLCKHAGLRLRCDERGVTIIKAGPRAKFDRFCVSGVLLITIPPRKAERGDLPRLAVFAEPRAKLLHGRGLQLRDASVLPGQNSTNGFWWPIKRLQDAPLKALGGSVDVLLAETQPTLEAPGATSQHSLSGPFPFDFSTGGVSLTVMRVVQEKANYNIDFQLATDPGEVNWDALLFSMRTGGLRIFDVDDRELSLVTVSCNGVGPVNNVRLIASPQANPQSPIARRPYKLIWDLPAKTVALTIRFQIDDLPAVGK